MAKNPEETIRRMNEKIEVLYAEMKSDPIYGISNTFKDFAERLKAIKEQ